MSSTRRHPEDQRPLVLVVDDEPDVLLLIRFAMESHGWRVELAENGEECLEQAARWRPDAIVLGVMMPVMDGWQALELLRRSDHAATTPVVLCTSRVQDPDRVRGHRLGCDDYVTRPFSPVALARTVARHLGRVHEEPGLDPLWPDDPVAVLRWLGTRLPRSTSADDALDVARVDRGLLTSQLPDDDELAAHVLSVRSLVVGATALHLLEDAAARLDRDELTRFDDVPWDALTERHSGPLGEALDAASLTLLRGLWDHAPAWLLLRHAPGRCHPVQRTRLRSGLGPGPAPDGSGEWESVAERLAALRAMVEADDPWVAVLLRPDDHLPRGWPLGRQPPLVGDGWVVEEVPAGIVDDADWSERVLPLAPGGIEDQLLRQRVVRTGRLWTTPGKPPAGRLSVPEAWQRAIRS